MLKIWSNTPENTTRVESSDNIDKSPTLRIKNPGPTTQSKKPENVDANIVNIDTATPIQYVKQQFQS